MIQSSYNRWVEVDLSAIRYNLKCVRNNIKQGVKILGVVKGDAYGHGALGVARLLEAEGVDMLGVTSVQEGKELREGGIKTPVLIFAPLLPEEIEIAIKNELRITVSHIQMAEWVIDISKELNRKAIIHLKIETGMGRTGLWPKDVIKVATKLNNSNHIEVEGVYSHLATAMWKDKRYVNKQYGIYKEVLDELIKAGINIPLKHISNSAAALDLPELNLDMVRVGTLLYGQVPSNEVSTKLSLKDPWKLKAKIIYIHQVPKGHSVGYSRTFIAKRDTTIAIVPMGFIDGIQQEPVSKPASFIEVIKISVKSFLSWIGHKRMLPLARYKGNDVPFVGKVGMQLSMLDITNFPNIQIGEIVELPARRTAVSKDIKRVYLNEHEISLVTNEE